MELLRPIGLPLTLEHGSSFLAAPRAEQKHSLVDVYILRRASELGMGDPELNGPSSSPQDGSQPTRRCIWESLPCPHAQGYGQQWHLWSGDFPGSLGTWIPGQGKWANAWRSGRLYLGEKGQTCGLGEGVWGAEARSGGRT